MALCLDEFLGDPLPYEIGSDDGGGDAEQPLDRNWQKLAKLAEGRGSFGALFKDPQVFPACRGDAGLQNTRATGARGINARKVSGGHEFTNNRHRRCGAPFDPNRQRSGGGLAKHFQMRFSSHGINLANRRAGGGGHVCARV